jgi:hypothetical protein
MPAQMHKTSGHAGLIKSLPSGHHNLSLQSNESAALSDFYGKTGLFLPPPQLPLSSNKGNFSKQTHRQKLYPQFEAPPSTESSPLS